MRALEEAVSSSCLLAPGGSTDLISPPDVSKHEQQIFGATNPPRGDNLSRWGSWTEHHTSEGNGLVKRFENLGGKVPCNHRAVVHYGPVTLGICARDHQHSSFSLQGPHGMELGLCSRLPSGRAVCWGCARLGLLSEMLHCESWDTLIPTQGSTKRSEHVHNAW